MVGKAKKAFSRPPSTKANEEYGMKPRKKISSATMSLGKGMGNVETSFMPRTKKAATGAMQGRAMPSTKTPGTPRPPTMKKRGQFKKAGGKKVF